MVGNGIDEAHGFRQDAAVPRGETRQEGMYGGTAGPWEGKRSRFSLGSP